MKENLINLSFLARGLVFQDIVVTTDEPIAADEMVRMLNSHEASTSIHEDNNVILADGTVIGTVRFSDTELEFVSFHVEDGNYEQESPVQPFNASRLAYAGAMGEFIAEDEELTLGDIHHILTLADNDIPIGLPVEERYCGMTGRQLLREIELMQRGLMNLMTIAHQAGKQGKEII